MIECSELIDSSEIISGCPFQRLSKSGHTSSLTPQKLKK